MAQRRWRLDEVHNNFFTSRELRGIGGADEDIKGLQDEPRRRYWDWHRGFWDFTVPLILVLWGGAMQTIRVVDVLREFVANGLADFQVGLADKVMGGCEPAEVGHSLQVPDDDAWFHADRHPIAAGSPTLRRWP